MAKFKLSDLVFLFEPLELKKWVAKKVWDATVRLPQVLEKAAEEEAKKHQDYLFGLDGAGLAAVSGVNHWASATGAGNHFGEGAHGGGYPAPPYDLTGLRNLGDRLPGGWRGFVAHPNETPVNLPANILFMGAGRINRAVQGIRDSIEGVRLPLGFVERASLPKGVGQLGIPPSLRRVFKDGTGEVFEKTSSTKKVLVDRTASQTKPFGPTYNSDGSLYRDVLLLTVLPWHNGQRAIMVEPGHGAGSRLADVFFGRKALSEIHSSVLGQPFPWFQAVFTLGVTVEDHLERYEDPNLELVKPLGLVTLAPQERSEQA